MSSASVKNKIQPGDGDPRHGTKNGYNNHDCRCTACAAAWAVYHREWMHAKPDRSERHNARNRRRYSDSRTP